MVTFLPDERAADTGATIETGLFLGVREEPALESTQLRWQVRLHPGDIVQVKSSATYLEHLGERFSSPPRSRWRKRNPAKRVVRSAG